jgi:hypothetical protein
MLEIMDTKSKYSLSKIRVNSRLTVRAFLGVLNYFWTKHYL